MDAFESVIAAILQRQGFWTLTSVKVELTKDEKVAIGRHSSPRWELDVVAYRGADNLIRVVECKSYLDSPGVDLRALNGANKKAETRYKLFVEKKLREVVLNRLEHQLVEAGFCASKPTIQLCLAAGKISGAEAPLRAHFEGNGWRLFGPSYIREQLEALRDAGYENSVAAVVTKLLLRGKKTGQSNVTLDADA